MSHWSKQKKLLSKSPPLEPQDRRKISYGKGGPEGGGGEIEMSPTMVGQQQKMKKKHLLKRSKAVPPKI